MILYGTWLITVFTDTCRIELLHWLGFATFKQMLYVVCYWYPFFLSKLSITWLFLNHVCVPFAVQIHPKFNIFMKVFCDTFVSSISSKVFKPAIKMLLCKSVLAVKVSWLCIHKVRAFVMQSLSCTCKWSHCLIPIMGISRVLFPSNVPCISQNGNILTV